MSLNNQAEFLFERDDDDQVPHFTQQDTQHITLNDANLWSYAQGHILFNSSNLVGNDSRKLLSLRQSYMTIPFIASLSCSCDTGVISFGGYSPVTSQYSHAPCNAYALGVKGMQHLVNLLHLSFGSSQIENSSDYFNFFTQHNSINKMGSEEFAKMKEMMVCSMDSSESWTPSTAVLEYNNRTYSANASNTNLSLGSVPGAFVNRGNIERLRVTNEYDWISAGSNYQLGTLFPMQAVTDCIQGGLIGIHDATGASIPIGATSSTAIVTLSFQFIATVPLKYVSDFYKHVGLLAAISQLDMRLQTNLGPSNSWSVTFGAANQDQSFTPTSVSSTQSQGQTCPFMVSSPMRNNGSSGCQLYTSVATAVPTLTIKTQIGYWANQIGSLALASNKLPTLPGNVLPCQIHIPAITYVDRLYKQIISKEPQLVTWDSYQIDASDINIVSNAMHSRVIPNQLRCLKKLYVLPFLSDYGNATAVLPYKSCISSAPNTCSPCRLVQVQLQIGGVNVFAQSQSVSADWFYNLIQPTLGQQNANCFDSYFRSGLVSFKDFQMCQSALCIDLERVSDSVSFDRQKQLQIQFKIDHKDGVYFNVMYLMVYSQSAYIDPLTGLVTASPAA